MRDWLNSILVFIGTATLTDDEYNSMDLSHATSGVYDQASYDALAAVLKQREAISTLQNKLYGVYLAKGATITQIQIGSSNIFLGDVL